MILAGCKGKNVTEAGDRKTAIGYAMDLLKEGDVLLVAGKGHETYQIIGDKTIFFSDRDIILNKATKCK
jgi:UDP-N-acetylmuramoyl-L-alanyl-D-glutamate--2,6-diaminopimelate ligase